MAQDTPFFVEVTDATGTAVAVDKITFTLGSAAPQALTKAPFQFKVDSAGDATLEIEKASHHTYTFALKVAAATDDFTVSIAKSMVDIPRMVTLTKQAATGPGTGPGKNQMRVVLGAAREFLLVVGFDYPTDHSGGMAFEGLGTKRMHDLRDAGTIDDSTVITVFDAKSGLCNRWVMGRGSETLVAGGAFVWKSGWSMMTSEGVKPATLNRSSPNYPGPSVNGMAEVYRFIEEIGRLRPGTLEEFSVLSHSFHGGPILFDTDEKPEFRSGGARETERDPDDKDGRFFKDFTNTNMPNKDRFIAAFSANPFIRIWGCLATTSFMNIIRAASNAPNDTAATRIPVGDRTSFFDPTVVFPDNRPGLIQCLRDSVLKFNYLAFLATTTGKSVEGGAPGMGALFKFGSKLGFNMFIARDNVTPPGKPTIIGFKKEMTFLENNLGAVFSADGYLRYDP